MPGSPQNKMKQGCSYGWQAEYLITSLHRVRATRKTACVCKRQREIKEYVRALDNRIIISCHSTRNISETRSLHKRCLPMAGTRSLHHDLSLRKLRKTKRAKPVLLVCRSGDVHEILITLSVGSTQPSNDIQPRLNRLNFYLVKVPEPLKG